MAKKILLKRSNQKEGTDGPKLPSPSQIDYGEVTINYAKGVETLAIKNSDNEIVTLGNEIIIGNQTPSNDSHRKLFIDETDSSVKYHATDGWKSLSMGGGGEPVNIVQTTGTATDAVMSQNAVTNELNKKANVSHTHQSSQITGLSTVATSGSYDDLINKPSPYTLPTASSTILGGIKVGDNLSIEIDGTLNGIPTSWANITGKPEEFTPASHTHDVATVDSDGFMSSEDKIKIDGIHENATQVTFSQTQTSGTAIGTININGIPTTLYAPTAGEPVTYGNATATTVGLVKLGSDTIQNVAANSISNISSRTYAIQNNSNGQMVVNVPWTDTNTTYSVATTSENGLMSSVDKTKLDSIENGANKTTIDSELNGTSTNPVQNKIINNALNLKANKSTTLAGYGITDAKISSGTITIGEETITPLTAIPSEYVTDTELNAKGYQTASQVNSAISALVDSAPETLDTLNELAAALGDDPNFATTITSQIARKANISHTHKISDVTDLQTTLDEKASISHTHTASQVTDLATVATSGSYNDLSDKPSIPPAYVLPTASATTLGGIKVGAGLTISSGVLSATGGGTADSVEWSNITNKPETFTPSTHTHPLSQITDIKDLTIQVNGGTAEGTTQYTFNGSTAKSLNIQSGSNVSLSTSSGGLTISATDTTYSAGTGLNLSGTTFNLKKAGYYDIGGIRIGYTENDKNYAVRTTITDGQAYVHVPWINTTYSAGEGLSLGGTTFSVKPATSSEIGGIRLGFSRQGKNYPILSNSSGQAYVTVPWTDTTYSPGNGLTLLGTTFNLKSATPTTIGGVKTVGINNYWNGGAVIVSSDGVSEMGKYIDFHNSTDDALDYSTRLVSSTDSGVTILLPEHNGTLAVLDAPQTWTAYQDFTSGAGNSASDMRFKENVQPVSNILDKVLNIDVISYFWNKEGETKRDTFGVNATELQNLGGVFSKIVHERDDKEKTKWVEYDRIGVLLLEAFKEYVKKTDQKIKDLEEKIQSIKK